MSNGPCRLCEVSERLDAETEAMLVELMNLTFDREFAAGGTQLSNS